MKERQIVMENKDNTQLALFGSTNQPADILGNGVLVFGETKKDGKVIGKSARVIKRSGSGVTLASILGLSPKTDKDKLDGKFAEAGKAFKGMQTVRVAQIAADDTFTGGVVRENKAGDLTFVFKKVRLNGSNVSIDKAIAKLATAGMKPEDILKKIEEAIAANNGAINVEGQAAPEANAEPNTFGVTAEHIRKANESGDPVDLSKFSDDDLTAMIKVAASNPDCKEASDIEVLVLMAVDEKLAQMEPSDVAAARG